MPSYALVFLERERERVQTAKGKSLESRARSRKDRVKRICYILCLRVCFPREKLSSHDYYNSSCDDVAAHKDRKIIARELTIICRGN